MAENASNIESSSVTLAPFNPTDWLIRFKSTGGWWVTYGDNKTSIGWMLEGFTEEQQREARFIWQEVEHDDRRIDAIRTHMMTSGQWAVPQGHE